MRTLVLLSSSLLALPMAGCVGPSALPVRLSLAVVDAVSGLPIPDAVCTPGPCGDIPAQAGLVFMVIVSAPSYETRRQPYRIEADTDSAIGLRATGV